MKEMGENGTTGAGGKATASMICGIGSMLFFCAPFVNLLVPFLAIAGLVLGLMSVKSAKKGFAITGIITSAISLTLTLLAVLSLSSFFSETNEQGVFWGEMLEEAEQQAE